MEPNTVIELQQTQIRAMAAYIADLEARLLAPWVPTIRDELAQQQYAKAVAVEDAAECLRLLSMPGEPILVDPVPIEHVRAALSEIQFAAVLSGSVPWQTIVSGQTAILAGVTSIPRARIQAIQKAASEAKMLPPNYQIGEMEDSPLDRLGIVEVVTAPAHIMMAMGWGLASDVGDVPIRT